MNKAKNIFFCGLPESGKTYFILAFLSYLKNKQIKATVFQPFSTGAQKKQASEQKTDSELFLEFSSLHPAVSNPYHFSSSSPLILASSMEGSFVQLKKVEDCFEKVSFLGCPTMVEIIGGIMQPLNDSCCLLDWMKGKTSRVVWIMDVDEQKFSWNLAELKIMQNFFSVYVILNNYKKNFHSWWLEYLWKKIAEADNCQVLGLLPPIKNFSSIEEKNLQKIFQRVKKIFL